MKHILLYGAGAVGIAVGASLISEGMQLVIVARGATKDAILKDGISRTGLFKSIEIPPENVSVTDGLNTLPDGWADIVLICTKTLANQEIAQNLSCHRKKLSSDFRIILMQNGWGNDQAFLSFFNKEHLLGARVITGFRRTAPNVSCVTVHTAPILFGSLYGLDPSPAAPVADSINASGIPSALTDDLTGALWAKMLYNTTLNPLGAILNVSYGRLAESPSSRRIMDRLIDETFLVMDECGYKTYWDNPDAYRREFYNKLIPDTFSHRSSTLQDIENRKKTEIETLNGCIVRLADAHGLSVPYHRMLCELIRSLEDNY